MSRRTVSTAEVARMVRIRRTEQAKQDAIRDLAATDAVREAKEFGVSDPGRQLILTYQRRFDGAIKRWLSIEPTAPDFPTRSIALHTELSTYQRIIRELSTPPDEGETDGGPSEG